MNTNGQQNLSSYQISETQQQNHLIRQLELQITLLQEQQKLLHQTQAIIDQYGANTLELMWGNPHAILQPEAETVFGRSASRIHLLKALEEAKERVIMVCPWVSLRSINDEMQLRLRYLLDQGVQLNIGWGYGYDIGKKIQISRNGECSFNQDAWNNYNALPLLNQFKEKFPDQVQLKLLGSHSKYFVCDRAFAYVGSHNFLNCKVNPINTYSPDFLGDEVGTVIRSSQQIDKLIQRFENQPNLATLPDLGF